MATTTAKRTNYRPTAGSKSVFSRIFFGIFLFLILAAVSVFILLIFGRCSGEEFSSADFSRRTFYYFRIPLLKFQVTPIVRTDQKSVLVNYLHKKQLVPKGKKNWELARLQVSSNHPFEADELILARYLEQRNSAYDLRWLKWSQNNPKLARAFWPIAWRTANEDLYVLIPELFQLARYTPDPVELDSKMRALIVNQGARIAAGEYQLANYDRAAKVAAFVVAVAGKLQTDESEPTSDRAIAESADSAKEIQAQVANRGAELVVSEALPEFDPNAPEPEDLRDETEPVEPDDESPIDDAENGGDEISGEAINKGSENEDSKSEAKVPEPTVSDTPTSDESGSQ